MKKNHFQIVLYVLFVLLSACSMEANITDLNETISDVDSLQRKQPDFIHGEVVTTSSGAVIKGTFGEISETKKVTADITIQGAFYE